MTYKRKKYHTGDTHLKKRWRVRNRKKDLDQIDEDLKEGKSEKLLNQDVDLDLPGAAQHYCLHCARYFVDEQALNEHFKTKVHKRRLKALELEPYSIEESERAAGHGNFKQAVKRKIVTQNTEKPTDEDVKKILSKVWDSKITSRRHSALFVNGAKATEHFIYLTPHIDFAERLQKREQLQKVLQLRKSNIVLENVESLWQVYEDLNTKKEEYSKRKEEISRELGKLIKNDPDSNTTKKFKIQSDLIKDNLKKLKAPLWSAEEAAIIEVLKLPNNLHNRTPNEEKKIIHTYLHRPDNNKDHLKIGRELNLIELKKNENYYLKGNAAIFELGAKFYFSKVLRENKFVQFSNPDFVKSLIVEGCGQDHTSADNTFILHHDEDSKVNIDSRVHLTGGGSLCSFLAYHAKNILYPKVLPFKYFTMGRQYVPAPSEEDSLFHVSQSSVIEMFGAAKSAEDLDQMLDSLVELLKNTYSKLGYHFRLSLIPADKLFMWESHRVVAEMYSTSLKDYIEVANVSLSGDFISKRLMLTYVENKQNKFPHIISGTLLNVPKFLGCVLEHDADFSVPKLFKVENWTL
ncbi:unnamed protein product [Arctia plantaginis]|uniref:Zinc finger protein 593 homolog n=1 Tax=Arctia plantaginis TaxID=874455 RepID=A0A8S0YSD7_ARCPL|nr:unnamed protein product [Arctia plantaginis]